MIIDIGVNLCSEQMRDNVDSYIQRAKEKNVSHMILTSTSTDSLEFNLQLCEKHKGYLTTTWGLHPHNAKHLNSFETTIDKLHNPNIVAIGEFGLDYFRNISSPTQQIKAMEYFLELANKNQELPLFLHERQAHQDFLDIYKNHDVRNKAVVHCFTGDKNTVKNYLDLGLFVGITGWICDSRRNSELLEAIKYIPLDRMMFETDAPYLKPRTLKTKENINEPANLPFIIKEVATMLNIEFDTLVKTTYNNSIEFFNINKPCPTQIQKLKHT